MTAKYFAILTSQGAARLANATALGTRLNLTQMAVGDANGALPTPDPAQTKLINQKRIAPLNLLTIDPANTSQIIAEQIIPENEGGFWIREIGLYDDAGVLIAVANCPETYKPQLQEGSGRTQTIRMILIVSGTSAITLKIDPSVVLATRQYVDDKLIEVKAYADNLMKQHVADKDPHKQYAMAEAMDAALKDKQPLDKTLTELSGKNVAALLEYLGLGAIAGLGTPTGSLASGIIRIPMYNGSTVETLILQWMAAPALAAGGNATITFPTAFPGALRSLMATGGATAAGVPGINTYSIGATSCRIYNQSTSVSTQAGAIWALGS